MLLGCATLATATVANLVVNLTMAPRLPRSVVALFAYSLGDSLQMPSFTR